MRYHENTAKGGMSLYTQEDFTAVSAQVKHRLIRYLVPVAAALTLLVVSFMIRVQ